ncbi:ATP12 family chaperone protein [Fretibacter rubidus]|uniref:ATP12 family chaperone protein n=1 Tax=Fretibacter rubidus TaxID=570162 RepID=UPI00352A1C9F
MSKTFPKRFYKDVAVTQITGGYTVTLDGRTLKTPGKIALVMARKDHADLVAAEWDAVSEVINPAHMPITRMMNVAVERTPENRADLITEARRYGGTDLLCYRADNPSGLIDKQNQLWSPWLDWAAARGIELRTTDSVIAIDQDKAALDAIATTAEGYDDVALTLLVHLTAVYGSVILALAVMDGALAAGEGFDISRLDQSYQIEHWGEDEEAAEITAATRAETVTLAQLI